jgi:hypothetical protein
MGRGGVEPPTSRLSGASDCPVNSDIAPHFTLTAPAIRPTLSDAMSEIAEPILTPDLTPTNSTMLHTVTLLTSYMQPDNQVLIAVMSEDRNQF